VTEKRAIDKRARDFKRVENRGVAKYALMSLYYPVTKAELGLLSVPKNTLGGKKRKKESTKHGHNFRGWKNKLRSPIGEPIIRGHEHFKSCPLRYFESAISHDIPCGRTRGNTPIEPSHRHGQNKRK